MFFARTIKNLYIYVYRLAIKYLNIFLHINFNVNNYNSRKSKAIFKKGKFVKTIKNANKNFTFECMRNIYKEKEILHVLFP